MHSEEKEREREREWHESPAILVIYNIMTEINLCELQLNFCPISYFRVRTFFFDRSQTPDFILYHTWKMYI